MNERPRDVLNSIGLLVLRLGTAGLLLGGHGLRKVMNYGEMSTRFSDPLGVGSATSLALVVFAEVVCSLLLVLGLATRFAAIPIAIFALVAGFVHHADDPWRQRELPFLYLVPALTLLFTGAGRFALDHVIARTFTRRGG